MKMLRVVLHDNMSLRRTKETKGLTVLKVGYFLLFIS